MNILIGADFYPVRRAEEKMKKGEFEYLLGEIKPIVEKADYSLVNYESTFYGDKEEIAKFGPNMATDERSVELAMWCGFKCATLGNNHIHDYGDKGLKDLLECMKKKGMDIVGAGMTLTDADQILYKEICSETVAFINCCEHEFNIADEEHGGANPYNVVRQYYAIKEAKSRAKYIIVIVHGGSIGCQLPSPRMQEQYRFFVDAGADAVIVHHQHCFSGYEYYHGAPIVYGLGNLLFDKPWMKHTYWTHGYLTELVLDNENRFEVKLYPYIQCDEEPRVILKKDNDLKEFHKKLEELNNIIKNPKTLKEEYYKWVDDNDSQCKNAIGAINTNRYVLALQRRHFLPHFSKGTMFLLNYIYCEAHLDRMLRYLKKKYNVQ